MLAQLQHHLIGGRILIHVEFRHGGGVAGAEARRAHGPDALHLPHGFPVLLDGSIPRIKVYPKETVIAEKFETIVKRGLANSRMKDYYDLWMLSHDVSVDADTASRAIERTFNRRKTDMPERVPEGLLDEFARNESKIVQWKAFVRKNRISLPNADFTSVVRGVREFLMGLVHA